jgi:hypothetical protein
MNTITTKCLTVTTKYLTSVIVKDLDTGRNVEVQIHKDPSTGGLFGIETLHIPAVTGEIQSPFDANTRLKLAMPV